MLKLITFPRMILATTVACAFVMIKFRAPAPILKSTGKTAIKTAVRPVELAPPLLISKREEKLEKAPAAVVTQKIKPPTPQKPRRLAAKPRKKPAPPSLMPPPSDFPSLDAEIESTGDALAVDAGGPVDHMVVAAFEEPSLTPIEATMPNFAADDVMAAEPHVIDVVGELRKNDFNEISERLAKMKAELAVLSPIRPAAPKAEPELVRPVVKKPKPIKVVAKKTSPPSVAPILPPTAAITARRSEVESPAADEALRKVFPQAPEIPTAVLEVPRPKTAQKIETPTLGPTLAQVSAPSVRTLIPSLPAPRPMMVIRGENEVVAPVTTQETQIATRVVSTQSTTAEAMFEGAISGILEVDDDVTEWLSRRKRRGHIEVYLHPLGSPEPQDLIGSDLLTPKPEFSFQERRWRGAYRLTAGFFFHDSQQAEAEVHFPQAITFENFRRNLRFRIRREQVKEALRAARRPGEQTLVTAILYEAVPGDHRILSPVKGASVRALGLPGATSQPSNSLGEIRIGNLPPRSEVVIEVTAPGYLPAYRVVVTSQRVAHVPIYLVREQWVKAATGSPFIGNPQDPKAGVVIGRLFDPATQLPEANKKVQIASREPECNTALSHDERVYYFDIFPYPMLPATTSTGFFGFFNVGTCLRRVLRPDSRTAMLHVRPGSGQYVELGRGGKQDILGRILYPSNGEFFPVAGAKVRLARDPKSETETDDEGRFRVFGVDLPPGVVHLETRAHGFANAWHPLRWDPKSSPKRRTLFLLPKDELPKLEGLKGVLIGMAKPQFYGKVDGCFSVRLLDSMGNKVSDDKGPFVLEEKSFRRGQPCLNRDSRGYVFSELDRGEYLLQWLNPRNEVFRAHVFHVGPGRATISVE